jgi:hypothetical protein
MLANVTVIIDVGCVLLKIVCVTQDANVRVCFAHIQQFFEGFVRKLV